MCTFPDGLLYFQVPYNKQNCAFLSVLSQISNVPDNYTCARFRRNLAKHMAENAEQYLVNKHLYLFALSCFS